MRKNDIINIFCCFSEIFEQAYKIFVFEYKDYFRSEVVIDLENSNFESFLKFDFKGKDFYIDIKSKHEEDFLPKGKIYLKKYIDYLKDITSEEFKSESVSFYDDFCIIDINNYSFFKNKKAERDLKNNAIRWFDEKNIKFLYRYSS